MPYCRHERNGLSAWGKVLMFLGGLSHDRSKHARAGLTKIVTSGFATPAEEPSSHIAANLQLGNVNHCLRSWRPKHHQLGLADMMQVFTAMTTALGMSMTEQPSILFPEVWAYDKKLSSITNNKRDRGNWTEGEISIEALCARVGTAITLQLL